MKNKWYVSRQCYWGVEESDQNMVEIATGGLDYANPDMLVSKYAGEGEEYSDPRKAVVAAIEIKKLWKRNCPKLKINIARGYTGGCTMPFESSTIKELKTWAEKTYDSIPKCACGNVIPEDGGYTLPEYDYLDEKYCSESCADKAYEDFQNNKYAGKDNNR